MKVFHDRPVLVAAGLALTVGAVAGVAVGGGSDLFGGGRNGASAATSGPTTRPTPEKPVPAVPATSAPLTEGPVAVDQEVERLDGPVEPGTKRTEGGAVAAFSAYAVWLIGSPAAQDEPKQAVEVIGGDTLDSGDAEMMSGMRHADGDTFDAEHGAYRVIGHAGDADKPDQVMVEVAAPLTMGGSTRWAVVGGVVRWTADGWSVASMQPRETAQADTLRADRLTPKQRVSTLKGLGWRLFDESE